jgi:hypothetical protein
MINGDLSGPPDLLVYDDVSSIQAPQSCVEDIDKCYGGKIAAGRAVEVDTDLSIVRDPAAIHVDGLELDKAAAGERR